METILVKPQNKLETQELLEALKKLNVEAEIDPVSMKTGIPDAIKRGADDVAGHLREEIEWKDARQLLNE